MPGTPKMSVSPKIIPSESVRPKVKGSEIPWELKNKINKKQWIWKNFPP